MATIAQIIQSNNWKSSSFRDSTYVNRLFNDGILTNASEQARALLNALDETNVQSTMTTGLIDIDWAEQNFGDATDNKPAALEAFYDEAHVKTFYGNQWWAVRTIERDLMRSNEPNRLVLEHVGRFWATQLNKIMSATVSGMSDIAAITVGNGTANLSRQMVIDARGMKGDMGFGKLAKMYMNSTTLVDILSKQEAGTISKELVTERYGQVTVVKDGITQLVQSDTPTYVYGGATPIVVDDALSNGVISLVEQGAFAHSFKDMAQPLMYVNDPKAGNGVGKEEWGTKALYIMHPVGFSFKGVLGTSYANKSGLSLAELQGGGLYELKVDPKLSLIQNLRIKIGA
jgi:hypothetical protein